MPGRPLTGPPRCGARRSWGVANASCASTRREIEARVAQLRRQLANETAEVERIEAQLAGEDAALADDRVEMAQHGWADSAPPPTAPTGGEG